MDEQVKVKPAPGLRLTDPKSMLQVPETGILVTLSPYWNRRLKDGDAILVTDSNDSAANVPKKKREKLTNEVT